MTESAAVESETGRLSRHKAELFKLIVGERARRRPGIESLPRNQDGGLHVQASWAQQRLWFIDRLEGGGRGYNITSALQLRGLLDERVLRGALEALVKRHEALRTVFDAVDGEAYQEISGTGTVGWRKIDIGECSAAERDAQLKCQLRDEANEKFDLRTGPLIRARLIRLQPEHHVLLLTMHHIVSDGWSMGVLITEFAALYDALSTGRREQLKPLPIQYADYAHWQRQWLGGQELEKQLRYWRERLDGAPPELNLPTDRPRPLAQSYAGGYINVALDAELSTQLRALARRFDLTLFMVLHAAWSILLARLGGTDDVVVGTPIANRQRPEVEGLIGFFVNTLVLRLGVRPSATMEQFFDHVKEVTLGAYDHQDVPFEKIVEALQPQRRLNINPLFQVMFVLQNAPRNELQLSGLEVQLEDVDDDLAKFDLLLSLQDRGDQIAGTLNYASDLFDGRTVERWRECFIALLRAMVAGDSRCIGDLPIVPQIELDLIAGRFNCTDHPYRHDSLVHRLVEEQAERTPEHLALIHDERRLTYAELNRHANRLARRLREKGVGCGDLVGILVERCPAMIVGLLGILKSGAAYLPLDPSYPTDRLQFMVRDGSPSVVLTQAHLKNLLTEGEQEVVLLDADGGDFSGYDDRNLAFDPSSEPRLVYVIYTSGSTGQPKGTAMPHGAMMNLLEWQRRTFNSDHSSRVLQFAALSFDVAFQEIFSTLVVGDCLVLLDEWVRRDAKALAELIVRKHINRLFVPPLMLQGLAEELTQTNAVVPGELCDIITAGEQLRISPEIAALFQRLQNCRLHNHYGPTETHVVTSLTLTGDPAEWPALPSIGRPIFNTKIHILDSRHQVMPIGVPGEIYIGGANVAQGYLGRVELTAQRFVNVPGIDGRLYRTGDVGVWRSDGTIGYLGRNDDQVKLRGYRIELGEVESQLLRLESVREAAVVVREDAARNKRLVAYLAPTERSTLNVEEIRAQLKDLLPEYMVPSAFVLIAALPLTPTGKLDRRALPSPTQEAYETRSYEAPEGEIEAAVAGIWQALLRLERVGRFDNFFELGGHSLLATRVVAHVDRVFEVQIPLRSIFEKPTVAALSGCIVEQIADQLYTEES